MKIKDSVEDTYKSWNPTYIDIGLDDYQEAVLSYLHDIAYGIALLVENKLGQ